MKLIVDLDDATPYADLARILDGLAAQRPYVRGAVLQAGDDAAPAEPCYTCPRCGAVSYHPDDIREGYCGRCHDWTAPVPGPAEFPTGQNIAGGTTCPQSP